jgi:hypothetical protein
MTNSVRRKVRLGLARRLDHNTSPADPEEIMIFIKDLLYYYSGGF